jgi:hypothetical protein
MPIGRARVVAPGERNEEGAREPLACAGRGAHVRRSHLDPKERCIPGPGIGDVLIGCLLRLDLPERVARVISRADGSDAVEKRRTGPEVH